VAVVVDEMFAFMLAPDEESGPAIGEDGSCDVCNLLKLILLI
jgi:hypothetical protein